MAQSNIKLLLLQSNIKLLLLQSNIKPLLLQSNIKLLLLRFSPSEIVTQYNTFLPLAIYRRSMLEYKINFNLQ